MALTKQHMTTPESPSVLLMSIMGVNYTRYSIQKSLLCIAIITIKQKLFFIYTNSATLNNAVKLNTLKTEEGITHKTAVIDFKFN